jgi:hypothetical protein
MSLPPIAGAPAPAPKSGAPTAPRSPATRSIAQTPALDARVELSPEAARLRNQRALLRTALQATEEDVARVLRARFDEAGRADYLATIAQPDDLSPEATAERILGGITGYIYRAFRRSRPEANAGDLAEFERGVRSGLERGMKAARQVLEGLQALDPELARGVERTQSLVAAGLERFFTREREAGAAASAPRRT